VIAQQQFNTPGFHPGDPAHVMRQYRRHILSCKAKWGTARGLVHYRAIVQTYLWAKRCSR